MGGKPTNVPHLGQSGGRPVRGVKSLSQGQYSVINGTKGGPPPVNLAKHTQGRRGSIVVNSTPAPRGR